MRVRLTQRIGQRKRSAGEFFGQRAGVFERTRSDRNLGGAARDERLDDLTADVARAEHEHASFSQRPEHAHRQFDGDIAKAHLSLRDAGVGARPGASLEGALEDAVEYRAGHAASERIGVGILDLAGNLDLADHLRL